MSIIEKLKHTETYRWLGAVGVLSATVLCAGCGSAIRVPATVPVKGVVKYKGKPARGVRVTLHCLDKPTEGNFVPIGESGADGSFLLSTGEPFNGAPPGNYVVTFERPMLDPRKSVETEIDGFKGKFSDPTQSKWNITVQTSETILEPFELN